jgi:hypothetical protein
MKKAVPGWHAQRVAPVVSDPALVLTDLAARPGPDGASGVHTAQLW